MIDNGVQTTYYRDADTDGYGSGLLTTGACAVAPTGYTSLGTDCNDTDARLHPATIRYADADSDGFSTGATQVQCTQPVGYSLPGSLVTSSLTGTSLTGGLVGHRTFDRLDGRDSSTKGYTGTLTNNVKFTSGKIAKAGSFNDISAYVAIPSTSDLMLQDNTMTFAAWIYISPGEADGYILSKPWNSNGQYNYRLLYGSQTIALSIL